MREFGLKFLIIFLVIFMGLLFVFLPDNNITFLCTRQDNLCTLSSYNIFHYKHVENIEFDKILRSGVEKESGEKIESIGRHRAYTTPAYYYNWVIYYNNNGKADKLIVFQSSMYEDKLYNNEYRYYEDVSQIFNAFLEDKTKFRIFIPEYDSNKKKILDYSIQLFFAAFMITMILLYTYIGISILFDEIKNFFKH